MSKSLPARPELLKTLDETLRKVGVQSVLLSDAVAKLVGANPTDLECLDLLSLGGPTTAGRLAAHTGLTTGAMTAVIDRLERAGFARRLRNTEDRRSVLVEALPERLHQIEALYQPLAVAVARLNEEYRRSTADRRRRLPGARSDTRRRTPGLAADAAAIDPGGAGAPEAPPPRCQRGAGAAITGHAGVTRPPRRGRLCGPRRLNNLHERFPPRRTERAMPNRRWMFLHVAGAVWLAATPALAQTPGCSRRTTDTRASADARRAAERGGRHCAGGHPPRRGRPGPRAQRRTAAALGVGQLRACARIGIRRRLR